MSIKHGNLLKTSGIALGILMLISQASWSITISDYAVFSDSSTSIKDRTRVTNGYVGSNVYCDIGSDAKITGNIISGGNVLLEDRCIDTGNVTAGGTVTRLNCHRALQNVPGKVHFKVYHPD